MKTDVSTPVLHYRSDELEKDIDNTLSKLESQISNRGDADGILCIPALEETSMAPYWEEHYYQYQSLLDSVEGSLQFQTRAQEVLAKRTETALEKTRLNQKLQDAKDERIEIEAPLRKYPTPPAKKRQPWWPWIIAGCLCLVDGVASILVWQNFGLTLREAIGVAIVFSAALLGLAHSTPKIIALGKTRWQRILIASVLLLLLIAMFGYCAEERAEYLNEINAENSPSGISSRINALGFIALSLLMFITSVALCFFYTSRKVDNSAWNEYRKLIQQRKQNEALQSGIEQQIKDAQSSLNETEKMAGSIVIRGRYLEQKIINAAMRCYGLYKSRNLRNRPDKTKTPICFTAPYPFEFETKFQTIFNQFNDEHN